MSGSSEILAPPPKKKVLVVIGTRPEAIKLVPVIRALHARPEIEVRTCVTAQHREMLDQMLRTFELSPDYDLDVMSHGQSITQVARAVMDGLEAVIAEERPDWVLVQGDTTSAMSAAIAAFHENVRVGHVEAGLRTSQLYSPFPEEGNRRLTAAITELHFAPTHWAADNIRREGVPSSAVIVTGNTVVDALNETRALPFDAEREGLEGMIDDDGRPIVLVTAHRRENFGTPIERVCHAIRGAALEHPNVKFICPVHLNQTVRMPFFRILSGLENVSLLPPLNYRAMGWVLDRCSFVVTDSGGLQEEAAALQRPVLVLRRSTERPEGVQAGVARLVGTNTGRVLEEIHTLLTDREAYMAMATCPNPYGDGLAGARIAAALVSHGDENVTADVALGGAQTATAELDPRMIVESEAELDAVRAETPAVPGPGVPINTETI